MDRLLPSSVLTARASALLLGALALAPRADAQDAARSLTELPTLGGSATAYGINQAGTVFGESRDGRISRDIRDERASWKAFIARPGEPLRALESFAGLDAMRMNGRDVIVGQRFGSNSQRYAAFRWTASEGTVNLPAPPGARYGTPVDIDDAGNVLMNANGNGFVLRAATEDYVTLACLAAYTCSAVAMNEAGAIVGVAHPSIAGDAPGVPVYWSAASAPPVVLPRPADGEAEPRDLNDRGTIVGVAVTASGSQVLAWRGDAHTLITLGAGSAHALNGRDVAAGDCPGHEEGPQTLPCLWDLQRGTETVLPPLNPQDSRVTLSGINDAGVAVGTAYDADGNGHPVVYRGYAPAP
ncbi:MAG: hypothetical protein ABW252_14130 [Polyangiales bacterium]